MSHAIPELQTARLRIRPLALSDLDDCHALFGALGWNDAQRSAEENLARRRSWLEWQVRSYEELASLAQPPYGDRAVVLRETGTFVGLVGLVPSYAPFGRFPAFGGVRDAFRSAEVGLFYALDPAHRRLGYATEAARALVDYAFDALDLGRIVATTERTNDDSRAVMARLGMQVDVLTPAPARSPDCVGLLRRGAAGAAP